MKKVNYFCLFLCLLVFKSFSQDALLDYAKVFLLHPKIANYHFGLNTFYKQNTSMDERVKIGNDLQVLNNQMIKEFKVGSQALKDGYNLDKHGLLIEAQKHKNKNANTRYFEILAQIAELKQGFLEKQDTLRALIQENRAKSISKFFVSSKERNKIFYSISKEIKAKAFSLKKKHGYENIFQGSDKLKLPIKTVDYSKLPLSQLPFVTIDNYFVAFVSDSKTVGSLINDHKKYEGVTKDKFVNQTEHESLDYYLSSYMLAHPFAPVTGNTINISYDVLKLLYDQYQVPTIKLDNAYTK
ncbi:MAG: hypothetical protein KC646_04360 [Candidatus Cloacimonetes bacterium]|nr:hypothetical protein [Candidatus Cloacimonadota bacterium]